MTGRARVSVVIAVSDAETHLQAAVRSALAAADDELEVLVVDNGSTDRSAAVVAGERDPRLLRLRLRPGQGAARPRNVGIARATAPYVAFLDPNDRLEPGRLCAAANMLDRHPEAGFAFADFACIDTSGNIIRPSGMAGFSAFAALAREPLAGNWSLIRQAHLSRVLLYGQYIGTSGAVVRRQLFTEIGPLDEEAACCTDLDLWFRLAHRCDALYSSDRGHAQREQPGVNTGATRAAVEECNAVLRRERGRWSERAARRELDRRIAENLAQVALEERRRRHRLRSMAMFAYAFATCPEIRWLGGMLSTMVP